MSSKKCCAECFGDDSLRDEIIPLRAASAQDGGSTLGTCDFCGTSGVITVSPGVLLEFFEPLLEIYEADESGCSIVELLRADWNLFPSMGVSDAAILLGEILDNGDYARKNYISPAISKEDRQRQWRELRHEMMHANRWFLPESISLDLKELAGILSYLSVKPGAISERWHRARISPGSEIIDRAEMGAPPIGLASHGRANPAGISYLYVASQDEGSVSEVRPHTGQYVSVAELVLEECALVDLRKPRAKVSPFFADGVVAVEELLAWIPLLESLGEELSKPVAPESAAYEYAPSQYLREFIKYCGFEGVVYGSSVSEGANLALFNPQRASIEKVRLCRVGKLTLTPEWVGI